MLLIIAGFFALMAAGSRIAPATIAGVLAAGLGAWELHGVGRLRNGDEQGLNDLILAQIGLFLVILGYSIWQQFHFDPEIILNPVMVQWFDKLQLPRSEQLAMAKSSHTLTYFLLPVLSAAYQGGFAWFYQSKRTAIRAALVQAE